MKRGNKNPNLRSMFNFQKIQRSTEDNQTPTSAAKLATSRQERDRFTEYEVCTCNGDGLLVHEKSMIER
jgi:hypothetical protein